MHGYHASAFLLFGVCCTGFASYDAYNLLVGFTCLLLFLAEFLYFIHNWTVDVPVVHLYFHLFCIEKGSEKA